MWERCRRYMVVMGGPSRFLRKAAAKQGVGGGRAGSMYTHRHRPGHLSSNLVGPIPKEVLGARRQKHLRQRVQAHEENSSRPGRTRPSIGPRGRCEGTVGLWDARPAGTLPLPQAALFSWFIVIKDLPLNRTQSAFRTRRTHYYAAQGAFFRATPI